MANRYPLIVDSATQQLKELPSGDTLVVDNLQVTGTSTVIETTNLSVEDKNITLNYSSGDSSAGADGAGITIQDAVNSTTDATILWNQTASTFDFSHALTIPGASTTADITFGDNDKAIFGAGSDLQIYHDGTHSYVADVGSGVLFIRGETNVVLESNSGSNYFEGTAGGASRVYYAGNEKLTTTATGIDVTGTVTADGLTVADTTGTVATFTSSGVTTALNMDNTHANGWGSNIAFKTGGTAAGYFGSIGSLLGNTDQDLSVYATAGNGVRVYTNGANERMRITSAGLVGIGTSSPAYKLDVQGGSSRFQYNAANQTAGEFYNTNATGYGVFIQGGGAASRYALNVTDYAGTSILYAGNSNNVGIGTTSPAELVSLDKSSGDTFVRFDKSGAFKGLVGISDSAGSGSGSAVAGDIILRSQTRVLLDTAGTTRAVVDASGNVGIGTDSPLSKLNVKGTQGNWRVDPDSVSGEIQVLSTTTANDGFRDFRLRADEVIVDTAGTERMRIDSSGNVGIGTTSPGAKLAVVGTTKIGEGVASNTSKLMVNTTSGTAAGIQLFQDSVESWIIQNPASSTALTFANSGSERMRIDSSGNVGIGTNAPSYNLQVASAATAATAFFSSTATPAYNSSGYNGSSARLQLVGGSASGAQTGINLSQGGAFELFIGGVQESGGAAAFVVQGYDGSAYSERMRITSAGNVGIGTSNPVYDFVVSNGGAEGLEISAGGISSNRINTIAYNRGTSAYADMYMDAANIILLPPGGGGGNVGIGTTSPNAPLTVQGGSATSPTIQLKGGSFGNDNASIQSLYDLTLKADSSEAIAGRTIGFAVGSTQAMTIDSSGNLLVGKTAVDNSVVGVTASGGQLSAVCQDAAPLFGNRTNSDGDIALFRKDNATVGSIGAYNSVVYFAGPNANAGGFRIDSSGSNGVIIPTTNTGANRDAAVDLGYSSGGTDIRFKDLYLSGLANVGGVYNAGIYNQTSGDIQFWVPNVGEAVRIQANTGNVGIGTSNPSATDFNASSTVLQVKKDTTDGGIFKASSSNTDFVLSAGNNLAYVATTTSTPISFMTNTTERMRIDASGNVGIGTSSPSSFNQRVNAPHLVVGSGSNSPGLTLYSGTAAQSSINFAIGTTTTQQYDGGLVYVPNGGSPYLTFNVNGGSERMRIDSSGQVGIGATSPGQRLHVSDATAVTRALIENTNNASAGAGVQFITKNGGTQVSNATLRTDNAGNFAIFTGTTGEAERMRINASGDWMVANTVANTASAYSTQAGCGWVNSDTHFEIATTSNRSALEIGKNNANDGNLLVFRKQGNPVGSIGVDSGDNLYIGGSVADHGGLYFGTRVAAPINAGTLTDAVMDLGTAGYRFKDLYLSEGIDLSSDGAGGVGTNTIGFRHTINTAGDAASIEASYSGDYRANLIFKINTSQSNTAAVEVARLDNSGNLLVGKTSVGPTIAGTEIKANGELNCAVSSGNDFLNMYSTTASAYRFYITNGGVIHASSTSISSISDASLKENVRDLDKGLDTILALKPRRFDWKNGDGNDIMGFVAQEVQETLPELVHDYKYNDSETKLSLKMGDMIPSLVKAIQEQQEIINDLRARVAQLEGA